MKKIDNRLYYQVAAWMINDLNLKGQELICYAIIYSLSQLGQGRYLAGLDYLASFMQCSQPTASKALKGLQKRGLIKKEEVTTDTGRRVLYYCSNPDEDEKESYRGVNKNFIDGVNKKFMDNNINNKEYNNNKKLSNDNQKVEYSEDFENFWKLYGYSKGKQRAYVKWNKLSDTDKQKAIDAIPAYLEDCARCKRDQQHAATYLFNHTFEDDFSAKPKRALYDPIEGEDEQKTRFKRWMRANYPEIEATALPLSYEDYMELVKGDHIEDVTNALTNIHNEIYKYRRSDIAQVIKAMLPKEDD